MRSLHPAPDPTTRLRRLAALPGDERAAGPLLEAIGDESPYVARQALQRLVRVASAAEIRALRDRMLTLDVGLVGDVAAALRDAGGEGAAELAIDALGSGSWPLRQKAVLALRELADPRARAVLLAALGDDIASVRRLALQALERLPGEPGTVAACAARLLDRDAGVRAAAVAAVASLDPNAAATLAPVARDRHLAVRRAAARAAAVLDASTVRELLVDRDAETRRATLAALARTPRPELLPAVCAALGDASWHVRVSAVDALGASGSRGASPLLVARLVDAHPLVRGRALMALERLAGANVDALLEAALADGDASVRRAVVEILGRRAVTAALPRLARDADPGVRHAVVRALERDSSLEAAAALRELARDPDDGVRQAARLGRGTS